MNYGIEKRKITHEKGKRHQKKHNGPSGDTLSSERATADRNKSVARQSLLFGRTIFATNAHVVLILIAQEVVSDQPTQKQQHNKPETHPKHVGARTADWVGATTTNACATQHTVERMHNAFRSTRRAHAHTLRRSMLQRMCRRIY